MAISGDLLKINGTTISDLKEYKVSYNKLWSDAERNMNGDVRATLIGIFPKLELTFRDALTEAEVATINSLLDQAYFSVTYYSPKSQTTVTAQYYASDYTLELLDKTKGIYKTFSVNLVPVSKL